jgi:heat shock protein HtpX
MLGTVALIIAISTLGFTLVLGLMGSLNLYSLVALVAIFNIAQWLLAPYLIKALYKVRRLDPAENPRLHMMVDELSEKSGIKRPKLMISGLPIPNAFAYGSPLTGSHVAVTQGLLDSLEPEEIEGVIGHELGHLKHRDVQVMMFISFLPSLFYFLARATMFSGLYGRRDRRDSGGFAIIGTVSMFLYFFLLLFNLGFSRLREYYADRHSAAIVEEGPRKLSEGLAKISNATFKVQRTTPAASGVSAFKALFISDPDRAARDAVDLGGTDIWGSDEELVKSIADRRLTGWDKFSELFSTHPNIVKRLRALRA